MDETDGLLRNVAFCAVLALAPSAEAQAQAFPSIRSVSEYDAHTRCAALLAVLATRAHEGAVDLPDDIADALPGQFGYSTTVIQRGLVASGEVPSVHAATHDLVLQEINRLVPRYEAAVLDATQPGEDGRRPLRQSIDVQQLIETDLRFCISERAVTRARDLVHQDASD